MRIRLNVVFILLIAITASFAWAKDAWPPNGWRLPTGSDYTGKWAKYRHEVPVPFQVSGDFNGDGFSDDAWILVGDGRDAFGFFVVLGGKNGSRRVVEVFSYKECCAQSYALALAPPGRRVTVCEQREECKYPASITLKYPGVEFITLGTAAALFYWSPRSKGFRSVPVSD
jgi:hypothetical protein